MVLGFIGGPASYYAGSTLTDVSLAAPLWQTLLILAVIWAIVVPLLQSFSEAWLKKPGFRGCLKSRVGYRQLLLRCSSSGIHAVVRPWQMGLKFRFCSSNSSLFSSQNRNLSSIFQGPRYAQTFKTASQGIE